MQYSPEPQQEGPSVVEYVLIVMLLVIIVVAILGIVGPQIFSSF